MLSQSLIGKHCDPMVDALVFNLDPVYWENKRSFSQKFFHRCTKLFKVVLSNDVFISKGIVCIMEIPIDAL